MNLIDDQGWILRNNVVWNKVKGGPDNSTVPTVQQFRMVWSMHDWLGRAPTLLVQSLDSSRETDEKRPLGPARVLTLLCVLS